MLHYSGFYQNNNNDSKANKLNKVRPTTLLLALLDVVVILSILHKLDHTVSESLRKGVTY